MHHHLRARPAIVVDDGRIAAAGVEAGGLEPPRRKLRPLRAGDGEIPGAAGASAVRKPAAAVRKRTTFGSAALAAKLEAGTAVRKSIAAVRKPAHLVRKQTAAGPAALAAKPAAIAAVRKAYAAVRKATAAVRKVTAAVPKATAAVPKATAAVRKVTAAVRKATAAVRKATVAVRKASTAGPAAPAAGLAAALPDQARRASGRKAAPPTSAKAELR